MLMLCIGSMLSICIAFDLAWQAKARTIQEV